MSASDRSARDKQMAAHLRSRGIWHGRRLTTPRHANYPSLSEVGSAAYRRRRAQQRGRA